MGQRIAVIGGGIAGLTAAYLLQRRYDVSLFEKSGRLGGNAYTLTTPNGDDVDIAAAVFGKASNKNLFKLFSELRIETAGAGLCGLTDLGMNFYDLDTRQGLSISPGLRSVLAQKFKTLRPRQVRSLIDATTGQRRTRMLLDSGSLDGLTVAQALQAVPQLAGLARLIFLGGLCLVSSMHGEDVLAAPAAFFIEKQKKYPDLFFPKAFFSTRFTKRRTRTYIEALSAGYQEHIVLNAAIDTVVRRNDHVLVALRDGGSARFDKVVFACNADQALALLREPTGEEQRLLGAWRYTEGRVVVHSDHARFPRRELLGGYTFLHRERGGAFETSVTGSLWVLPGVSRNCDLLSTQHPNFPIARDRIVFEKIFRTPLFDFPAYAALRELPSLNGIRNTYYCGSHFGFGLHEDAVTSAIEVARLLKVDC